MSRGSYVAWTTKRTSHPRNPKFCLAEQKCGGLGKTSLVCIKNFSSKSANQLFKNRENDVSGSFKIACQDPSKSQCSFPIKIKPITIWLCGGDEKSYDFIGCVVNITFIGIIYLFKKFLIALGIQSCQI